jgi:predicted anti-sigma-YlaC factor YlaD
MDCSDAREAISALLDDEPLGVDPSELTSHVADCGDCDAWRESAHRVTRRVRLSAAESAPTPGPSLFAAVHAEMQATPRTRSALTAARLGLVAIAIAQIVLTLPALIFGSDHEAPMHVAHEMGSFGMALAVGFLIVAWQPQRARGMHLLVGAAAALLLTTAVIDLLAGRTSLSDEAPHLLVLLGWMLMYRVAAQAPFEADAGRGQTLLRQPWRSISGPHAPVWQTEPEHDAGVGAGAPAVERRAASA